MHNPGSSEDLGTCISFNLEIFSVKGCDSVSSVFDLTAGQQVFSVFLIRAFFFVGSFREGRSIFDVSVPLTSS